MKQTLVFILFITTVAGAATSYYFYNRYQEAQKVASSPQEAVRAEAKRILQSLGQFMTLPKDETPTIATVADKQKLKNQPFFAKAQNGDKLILFTKSRKAILYRPSTNKIIETAAINVGKPQGQKSTPTSTPVPTKKPSK